MNKKLLIAISIFVISLALFATKQASAENATDSSATVREKVQEKVEKVLKSPRAYVGTITDISESTIQVSRLVFNTEKEKAGEILQISTTEETTFVNVKTTSKTIKRSDLAIGDFIVAMGYKNGNSVLEAKRILVVSAITPSERVSIMGTVEKAEKTSLTVTIKKTGKAITIKSSKTLKITTTKGGKTQSLDFDEVVKGDRIIAVGIHSGEALDARSIHILSPDEENAKAFPSPSPNVSPSPKASPKAAATP